MLLCAFRSERAVTHQHQDKEARGMGTAPEQSDKENIEAENIKHLHSKMFVHCIIVGAETRRRKFGCPPWRQWKTGACVWEE